MLRMPDTRALLLLLPEAARHNLERFESSGAAKELRASPHDWRVMEWSWTSDSPTSVRLQRDDFGELLEVWMEEGGLWRWERMPIELRVRR